MNILQSIFGPKIDKGICLDINKHDVFDMKDTDQTDQEKTYMHLRTTTEVLDRRVVMLYEKRFMERFKKIGNLHQKCPYCSKAYKSLNLGEKKCTECNKIFFVQKRVQDMGTAAYMSENKAQFDLQWKVTSQVKKFRHYLPKEYDYIQKQLQKQGKKHLQTSDVMHSLINAYAKNSLNSGYYQLYAAFIFHKAELMRSEQRFAEALVYYFYVHFLQTNGVENSGDMQTSLIMNPELREKIADLLALGKIQVKKSQDLYNYAIMHLSAFNESSLSVGMYKSYSLLMKEFKNEDQQKDEQKPMRSFVLYTKAS